MQNTPSLIKLVSSLFGLLLLVATTGCNKEPVYTPISTKTTTVYEFWLEKTKSNATINRPYQGMIVGDSAIRLMVDYGTDITALEPTIIADADSIAPKGKQNFTNPVHYTVWANGKSASYTVKITVSAIQFPVITSMAAGFNHVMALKNDGTVWVCGDNASGQLGLGDLSARNKLTQVPVYDVQQIFTGEAASIIKLKDGTTWGSGNQWGQLGLGNKNYIVNFTRVPFLDDAVQIAITFDEVFALKSDGVLWGAGRNYDKTLAQGDADLHASFVKIPISSVKQINGCAAHMVVQKTNGEVWGWGSNISGQLGLGDKQDRYTPVLLPTPAVGISKIFAGSTTSILIDKNGKVWGAGANMNGQLGLGDQANRTSFTQISFFDNKSIDFIIPRTAGTGFKETNGNTWNVGDNVRGLMGLGTQSTLPYTTPVQLNGFTSTALSGCGQTAFALKNDGTLWAWGNNGSGVLGTGSDIEAVLSPIQIK